MVATLINLKEKELEDVICFDTPRLGTTLSVDGKGEDGARRSTLERFDRAPVTSGGSIIAPGQLSQYRALGRCQTSRQPQPDIARIEVVIFWSSVNVTAVLHSNAVLLYTSK